MTMLTGICKVRSTTRIYNQTNLGYPHKNEYRLLRLFVGFFGFVYMYINNSFDNMYDEFGAKT